MSELAGLPSARWSLRGLTDDGDEAWLIRGVSRKLYRCPGCHGDIEIGTEHTIVQYVHRLGGTEHHHWHRRCAEELLVPELRGLKRVPAGESSQGKLEARGRRQVRPSRRRRRDADLREALALYVRIWRTYFAGPARCCRWRSSSSSRSA